MRLSAGRNRWSASSVLTGLEQAPEWVRARKAEGSDWIKIIYEDGSAFGMEIPSLDEETVAAVIAAAHAEGLTAVVHVSTLERALKAMAFGADGLVHVWRDEVISEADARRFAEADIFVVPSLSVMVSAEDSAVAELVQGTDEALLSPIQRQTLADRFSGGLAEGGEVAMENVRRLRAAGVRLVAGTDSPNPGTGAGISMHGELRLLSRASLGSAEALAAATSVAADAFGVADRGRIAEGHLADLVLVRGDLEEDLSRSHDIVAIWKDGYLVERAGGSAGAGPQAEATPANELQRQKARIPLEVGARGRGLLPQLEHRVPRPCVPESLRTTEWASDRTIRPVRVATRIRSPYFRAT